MCQLLRLEIYAPNLAGAVESEQGQRWGRARQENKYLLLFLENNAMVKIGS